MYLWTGTPLNRQSPRPWTSSRLVASSRVLSVGSGKVSGVRSMTSSPAASADASAASSSAISSSVSLCVHEPGSAARSGPSQPPGKVGSASPRTDEEEEEDDDDGATARAIGAWTRWRRVERDDMRATGATKAADVADIAADALLPPPPSVTGTPEI